MLIVFEGVDGCGKTTAVRAAAEALGRCATIHFPDDTARTGPAIRSYLNRAWRCGSFSAEGFDGIVSDERSALAFQALQLANRMERFGLLAAAAGSPTEHLVASRYWHSGVVYGSMDGLDPLWLEALHRHLPQADANVLLDLDESEAVRRRAVRDGGDPGEIYEAPGEVSHAAQLYRGLWDSRRSDGSYVTMDASQPIGVVRAAAAAIARGAARSPGWSG